MATSFARVIYIRNLIWIAALEVNTLLARSVSISLTLVPGYDAESRSLSTETYSPVLHPPPP